MRWLMFLWWGLLAVLGLLPLASAAQAPVVGPGDITTPVPLSVWPTPEPGQSYEVRPGDTLLTIALELGLDLSDAPCAIAPNFRADQPLVIGDLLSLPPAAVTCHQVEPGETVESIAAAYFVEPAEILGLAWNRLLPNAPLEPYTYLRVPRGEIRGMAADTGPSFLTKMLDMPVDSSPYLLFAEPVSQRQPQTAVQGPVPANWPYGSGVFAWPVYGWLSQGYRYDHRAIDVAAPQGTPVTAADRGVVLRAGWNNQGYGYFVILDHQIDYLTLYAHLDRVLVSEGEVVGKGQVIGTVGTTGNSTGPHLHFEIRDFGRLINPLEILTVP
ncbi:MAG: peptidoglycan DD-metalloendopeptidase family protein [Caldilinea sp.]